MTMDSKRKTRNTTFVLENELKKKMVSDNDDSSSSDEDYQVGTDDQDGDMDEIAFKQFLYKMFPSKNLKTQN